MREFRELVSDLVSLGAFSLEEIEQAARFEFVKGTLELNGFNQSHTARALGKHRNTVRRILLEMQKAGMDLKLRRQPRRARPAPAETGKRIA